MSERPEPSTNAELLSKILERLETLENRMSRWEAERRFEGMSSTIRLRPSKGQPIVPDLFSELLPNSKVDAIYSISDTEVDVSPIITETLSLTFMSVAEIINEKGEATTQEVADKLSKSRSTVSGRLNMLFRLGLLNKMQGKTNKYTLTEKGKNFLGEK